MATEVAFEKPLATVHVDLRVDGTAWWERLEGASVGDRQALRDDLQRRAQGLRDELGPPVLRVGAPRFERRAIDGLEVSVRVDADPDDGHDAAQVRSWLQSFASQLPDVLLGYLRRLLGDEAGAKVTSTSIQLADGIARPSATSSGRRRLKRWEVHLTWAIGVVAAVALAAFVALVLIEDGSIRWLIGVFDGLWVALAAGLLFEAFSRNGPARRD